MSVGLLLITHNRVGEELLNTATTTFAHCPMNAATLGIGERCDPDALAREARERLLSVDSGEGVLVLTDIYGSTPSNIANRLLDEGNVIVIAGLSLPMLIRVMNYCRLSLPELAQKAASAGAEGIVLSTAETRMP
ncbi:PTS sugar transporter subunit IIA [Plasticicumulans acidivorans]|uniref:PTS system ascorbate-specific IIA component n=1 Tax=Plasticicumulans acidivorans TaxID=886464 RepID=A0A317MUY6_9GAMM|nr:PTS fructose transporter subunit IIA [Plasticicumulans acidivorans]PWV61793.1 PTS system ascorbate-specific IIA component [Plasticicumulans acidivorans]